MPSTKKTRRRIGPTTAFLWAVGALLPAVAGLWYFLVEAPQVGLARLQLTGSADQAFAICEGRLSACQDALTAYYTLVVCCTSSLLLIFWLSYFVFPSKRGRHLAVLAMVVTAVGGLCGVVENSLIKHGLGLGQERAGNGWFALAAGLAALKWLIAMLTILALYQWLIALSRAGRVALPTAWRGLRRQPQADPTTATVTCQRRHGNDRPAVVPSWPVALEPDGTPWPTIPDNTYDAPQETPSHWRYEGATAPGRQHADTGICVSGGGIRSACVTLGALQALRKTLASASYLVSVSGGGYAVGAMQLALSDKEGEEAGPSTGNAFEPGSVEEDHLRRHSKYVADGTGEWLVALGVLLRGLLASLFLLGTATALLGLGLSWAYHLVPVTDLNHLAAPGTHFCPNHCTPPPRPLFRHPAVWAVLGLFAAAAVTWLIWLFATTWSRKEKLGILFARAFRLLVVLAVALATTVILVPLLAWWTIHLQLQLKVSRPQTGAGIGATVLISYAIALITTLWRRRQTLRSGLSKITDLLRGKPGLARAVPNGFTQYLLVWAVLALLAAAFLLLLGWSTATGWSWPTWAQIAVPGVLVLLGSSLDQTWMSLHPFYRRRLASCFAVRRSEDPRQPGVQIAEPYNFDTEITTLSTYGGQRNDFPQVIFAAAANLSGASRTPPGRRAVSFTFSRDYVGSPDVGYACTACLETHTKQHIARDLTVQSAMAISGAAFASAMGAQARAFQTFFALSNARLGSWLPNPSALAERWADDASWWLSPPPTIRRLPYLLREVFGRYPMDDRLLLVTDGGHYENLGLVELLRQGVRTAICIDASGDTPPFATTLAEAIALAYEELGVTITLDHPETLIPGSGEPLSPPSVLSDINTRLSKTAVITGTITYPKDLEIKDEQGRTTWAGREGRLIVARATLTGDLPYQLLSYAAAHPVFPRDSTSDQWFDHQQFDAYQTLGHCIGKRVQDLLDRPSTAPAT
ncbi:hypothetical protein SAMN05216489_04005 [Streptomyces sp. 3213]|uniref:hypothetical protein n=1 Tax=Streptomyces sp. 3213.3 TaxID=1855348 RepID=UPI0008952466|nr:hypothetical protein [Streptomyces sp. 3213.3]SED64600.1 hypothetical protein SAMN05216489_04005 [Streptomyces sp. 3213] [Streptomyces sp. 3213.3]